ncbi:MAG: hypothetical protein DWB42_17370 [Chloroflexi bacterium]|nr:hypothetical protein [Chloroflexota bacterium]MDL1885515.1 hypothetical protein [Anaerolineae bacterium CFX8]
MVDVAWNSDGTQIVSSGFTNAETFIWDVATGTIIKKVRLGTEIGVGVFWRPNSTQIASIGSGGKYAFVWDSVTGEILYALPQHADFTTSAAWSPDGSLLATGSIDQTVQLWDVTIRQSIRTLAHPSPVYAVAWSPAGDGIVSGDKSGTVRIWNALTGQTLHTLTGHTDAIEAVSWSSDGSRVASGSDDGTIRVWDATTGELMDVIQSTAGAIKDLAWSPTDDQLAYIGRDTGNQGGLPEIVLPALPALTSILFASSRDGNRDGNYEIYTMQPDGSGVTRLTTDAAEDGFYAVSVSEAYYGLSWSPDGTQLVFMSRRDGNLELYKMNADGTAQTRLTNTSDPEAFTDW